MLNQPSYPGAPKQRRFLSKAWKVWHGASLPLIVKFEKKEMKKKLLNKRNQKIKNWKILSLSLLHKYVEACPEGNTNDVPEQPFDKEMSVVMKHISN